MTRPGAEPEFEWERAIVTGGGSGLGRELALRLAASGVETWICGRRPDPLAETAALAASGGAPIHAVAADLRDPAQAERVVEAVSGDGAGMLVNNAAGTFVALAEEISANGWRAVVDASLNAPWYVTSAWARGRIAAGAGGVVLNIASATVESGSPGTVHSGAAKAGLVSMTRSLAVEWARFGIRVNALSPGAFETAGGGEWIWTDPGIRERIVSAIPLERMAGLEEIAEPALFLLSRAARYATGTVLKVDGGWTLSDWLYVDPTEEET